MAERWRPSIWIVAALLALAGVVIALLAGAGILDQGQAKAAKSSPSVTGGEASTQPDLPLDLANAVARAQLAGTDYIVAPRARSAAPGTLCFAVVESEGYTYGCGDGSNLQTRGGLFAEFAPESDVRVWGFVPAGLTTVSAAGETVATVSERFFSASIPVGTEMLTVTGPEGTLNLNVPPRPLD